MNADFVDFADALVAARKKAPIAATRTGKDGEGAPSDESGVERAEENTATKAVGVVAFNAMFGNLWNQGIALERAVDILEAWQIRNSRRRQSNAFVPVRFLSDRESRSRRLMSCRHTAFTWSPVSSDVHRYCCAISTSGEKVVRCGCN